MGIAVKETRKFVRKDAGATGGGDIYVFGSTSSGGGGTGDLTNYYTKAQLQAGALDDLYMDEITGDAERMLFTSAGGDAAVIGGYSIDDQSGYDVINLGRTGDSGTQIVLKGIGSFKPGATAAMNIYGGDGTVDGGDLNLAGGPAGSGVDGDVNIDGEIINIGDGDTPISLKGDVSIGLGLQVVNDASFGSSINVINNGVFGGDVSIGNDLWVTGEIKTDDYLGKDAFFSGFFGSGYRVEKDDDGYYSAELDNLVVRRTAHFYELVIDKIRATNGSLVVSDTAPAVYSNDDTSIFTPAGLYWESTGAKQYDWYFYTSPSENGLLEDDLIKAQQFKGDRVGLYEYVVQDLADDNSKVYVRHFGTERNDGGSAAGEQELINGASPDDMDTWNDAVSGYDWEGDQGDYFITTTIPIRGAGKIRVQGNFSDSIAITGGFSVTVQVRAADATLGTPISSFAYFSTPTGGGSGTFDVEMDVLYDLGVSTRWNNVNSKISFHIGSVGTARWCDEFNVTSIMDMTLSTANGTDNQIDGYDFVRWGNLTDTDRQGLVYLTASDSDAPFIQILDEMDTFTISAANQKGRFGNLEGINDTYVGGALDGYGIYTDNGYFKGTIWAADGSIAGWNITEDSIYTGTEKLTDGYATSGLTLANDGGFHAKNAYINSDGDAAFRQIEEAVFKIDTDDYGIKIQGGHIWENELDTSAGYVYINFKGYDGGTTLERSTIIGNGRGGSMMTFTGREDLSGTERTIKTSDQTPFRVGGGIGYMTHRTETGSGITKNYSRIVKYSNLTGKTFNMTADPFPNQEITVVNSGTVTMDVSGGAAGNLWTSSAQTTITLAAGGSLTAFYDWGGTDQQGKDNYYDARWQVTNVYTP